MKTGLVEYQGGREDYDGAAAKADACPAFSADDPDEWVSDQMPSCYNCRYRRWTPASFTCLKLFLSEPAG